MQNSSADVDMDWVMSSSGAVLSVDRALRQVAENKLVEKPKTDNFEITGAVLMLVCLQPLRNFPKANAEAVGEPLFLTPYIEAGQLDEARELARVDPTLLEVHLNLYFYQCCGSNHITLNTYFYLDKLLPNL
jgi:hypothetical protein